MIVMHKLHLHFEYSMCLNLTDFHNVVTIESAIQIMLITFSISYKDVIVPDNKCFLFIRGPKSHIICCCWYVRWMGELSYGLLANYMSTNYTLWQIFSLWRACDVVTFIWRTWGHLLSFKYLLYAFGSVNQVHNLWI